MLTHMQISSRGGGGSSNTTSSSSNTRTRSDTAGITTNRSNSAAATLTTPRGTRPAAQDPASPVAAGETAPISLPPGSSALISVSPRSAPSPAYCMSLMLSTTVAAAAATAQANHGGPGSTHHHNHHPPRRPCRELHMPAREHLASPLGGPTGHGYTGSVTQASSVQPHRPPPGASSSFAAAALAATATTRPRPSHWTAAGGIAPAHPTTTSDTLTNTAPAATTTTAAAAAAAGLATSAMCTGGSGPPLPSATSVRTLLNTVAPHMALDSGISVTPLPATHHHLQRTYELSASPSAAAAAAAAASRDRHDGRGAGAHDTLFVLALAPPSMLRLLRSEQWVIKSEAVVVRWIRGVLLTTGRGGSTPAPRGPPQAQQQRRGGRADEVVDDTSSRADTCTSCGADRQHCRFRVHDELLLEDLDLLGLLPSLIDHSQSGRELGSSYNILSHPRGQPLSSLPGVFTAPERRHVDFQAGRLTRRLSLLQSPSGKFGPAVSVLCPAAVTHSRAGGGMEKPGGVDRWSLAFHAMLEGILRDAEDMAVTISYQAIRRHFRRLRSCLDGVTVARLVILDAAHDSNLMVERKEGPIQNGGHDPRVEQIGPIAKSDHKDGGGGGGLMDGRYPPDIRVTGLRDWSNCTFGDPLLAMVFTEDPSEDFLRGFSGRGPQPPNGSGCGGGDDDICDLLTMCGDIVEHPEEALIRILLYQCYHATVAVVKEFYRPQSDSTSRELAARKRLHAVLARLEDIDEDDPKRRHIRPQGETSPAKKPRTGEGEDGDDNNNGYDEESPG